MPQNIANPLPCSDCLTLVTFSPEQLARLRSRDYNLRRIADLVFAEIGAQKSAEPATWFPKIIASIAADGVIQPLLVTSNADGLELIDGNHRAWAACKQQLPAPVHLFIPDCGNCTETMLREAAMVQTEKLGWKY